jgi:hypothetical protein
MKMKFVNFINLNLPWSKQQNLRNCYVSLHTSLRIITKEVPKLCGTLKLNVMAVILERMWSPDDG